VDEEPERKTWRPGFAVIAAELGFKEQAQRVLDESREANFSFPVDAKRSTTLSYLADVCTTLDDEASARMLYALLEPYRKLTIMAGVVTVCYGSAGRFLGNLAGVLGDWDRAEKHFEDALGIDRAMQAWPWLAHAQHDFARMLRRRGRRDDMKRAEALTNNRGRRRLASTCRALKEKLRTRLH
jgi:tetratricopeptide (TPR) repeat protein